MNAIVATEPKLLDFAEAQRRHESRLRVLNTMASVLNSVKPYTVSGVLRLGQRQAHAANDRYLLHCFRRVPELGCTLTLTRDFSEQLATIRLGHNVHLSVKRISDAGLSEMRLKLGPFEQIGEFDDTAAKDWVTTVFAPHHEHVWVETSPDGTQNFRLFTDSDYSRAVRVFPNQIRELRRGYKLKPIQEVYP